MSQQPATELQLPGNGGIVFIPPDPSPSSSTISPRMKKLRAQAAFAKMFADDRLVSFAKTQGVNVVTA